MSRVVAVLLAACGCASSSPPPVVPRAEMRVAVTVDDLPRHGPEAPGQDRLALHRALLDALGRHRVPRVYGFVNAGRARPEDRSALEAWVAAGYPLGNHTAHHPDIRTVGLDAYLADVDAGEPLLSELLGPGQEGVWKVRCARPCWNATTGSPR
jgi:peptidoglycan-N-acetylglucosamine deacetylase